MCQSATQTRGPAWFAITGIQLEYGLQWPGLVRFRFGFNRVGFCFWVCFCLEPDLQWVRHRLLLHHVCLLVGVDEVVVCVVSCSFLLLRAWFSSSSLLFSSDSEMMGQLVCRVDPVVSVLIWGALVCVLLLVFVVQVQMHLVL